MDMDAGLLEGARNAVQVCMNVGASDRVFILTDDETVAIAEALAQEAGKLGAEVTSARLEEFGPRPMTRLPEELAQKVISFSPTVTFYAASSKAYELPLRTGFVGLAMGQFGVRHAHMPSIKERLMREGMRADYHKVHDLTDEGPFVEREMVARMAALIQAGRQFSYDVARRMGRRAISAQRPSTPSPSGALPVWAPIAMLDGGVSAAKPFSRHHQATNVFRGALRI